MADNLRKILTLLELLAGQGLGLSAVDLGAQCDLPRNTTHRLLNILMEEKYIWRDSRHRYHLGGKVLKLAAGLSHQMAIRDAARPMMAELARKTQETIHLACLEGNMAVYVDKVETTHAVGLLSRVGSRVYLHSTSLGKAMLAFLGDDEVESIAQEVGLPAMTPATITNLAILRGRLREIRARGYALDEGENRAGVVCVAAPVLDVSSRPLGAISLSAPSSRLSTEQAEMLAAAVIATAERISGSLGFRKSV